MSQTSAMPAREEPRGGHGERAHPGFRKVVGAATIGNILEWYDWGAYAFLVTHIATNFFPSSDPTAGLLLSFATFGVGFGMRPIGAAVIGWIGDRHGRKVALMTTIFVMAIGTVLIAFIPSYATIGVWAPACLVACRLLQGFSTGGELGGSLAFMIEWAPEKRRGFYASFQQASTNGGLLLGSGTAALLNTVLSTEQMGGWGWRIPFLLGGLLLPVGIWMRRRIEETPAFREAAADREPAPGSGQAIRMILQAIGYIVALTTCQYLILTYLATFAVRYGGLSQAQALWSNTASLVVVIVFTPIMGGLSDRIGRKPLLVAANAVFVLTGYLVFSVIASKPGLAAIVALQLALGLLMSIFTGVGPVAVTELFPTKSRSFLLSVAYALGVAIFGGFAPYIATWMIEVTGSPVTPGHYVALTAIVTGVVIAFSRETAFARLR